VLNLTLDWWTGLMARRLGCTRDDVRRIARLDVAQQALMEADSVDTNGHELYPTAPMKAAVIVGRLSRQRVLPFDNRSCARHTGEAALARGGLRIDINNGTQRAYRALLKAVEKSQAHDYELARFYAAHVGRQPPLRTTEPPVDVQIFLAALVCQQEPEDRNLLYDIFKEVDNALMEGAKGSGLQVRIQPSFPGRMSAAPNEVWETSMSAVNNHAAGIVVLGHRGGGTGVGYELARFGNQRPALWLVEEGQAIPKLVLGATRYSALTIARFTSLDEVGPLVGLWVKLNLKRLLLAHRELREADATTMQARGDLSLRCEGLSDEELAELSNTTRLKYRRILDLLEDGGAFDRAPLNELRALASALGTTLDQVLSPQAQLTLSGVQRRALVQFTGEYGINGTQALELEAMGEREVARPDCRWSLTTPADWADLWVSRRREGE
jgi:hypothetical protein